MNVDYDGAIEFMCRTRNTNDKIGSYYNLAIKALQQQKQAEEDNERLRENANNRCGVLEILNPYDVAAEIQTALGLDFHPKFLECANNICLRLGDKASKTVEGWISVEDRLPEEDRKYSEEVLCITPYNYYIGRTISGNWTDYCNRNIGIDNITHWQPLPEPPANELNKEEG